MHLFFFFRGSSIFGSCPLFRRGAAKARQSRSRHFDSILREVQMHSILPFEEPIRPRMTSALSGGGGWCLVSITARNRGRQVRCPLMDVNHMYYCYSLIFTDVRCPKIIWCSNGVGNIGTSATFSWKTKLAQNAVSMEPGGGVQVFYCTDIRRRALLTDAPHKLMLCI